ncbi:MAG: cell surface protein [Paludibacter sp.]|nr:cell surface protein [Bacteroidales bacterium]MCM1069395.1 cell surface protein [Prevotella sp.]MCM1353915.1 cell surface protein [Bacteroides sp.]MCM1442835.1 cell surface protein [Muribaculum sp.]MCM1481880.1 cell surface protein [Paludibacter sp.]
MLLRTSLMGFALVIAATLSALNPNADKVWQYQPAPGQFVNVLPLYEEGDNADDMCRKVETAWADHEPITLGAWGGYVILGFDHMVPNVPDEYDLLIAGNATEPRLQPDGRYAGSAEPGVVSVCFDANGNGLPDDEWYMLAGSEQERVIYDYAITYYQPSDNHLAVLGKTWKFLTDSLYISWTDNRSSKGWISQNSFHQQNYWPAWLTDSELTFTGTLLPDNVEMQGNAGTSNILWCYDYGYADVFPATDKRSRFNIDWAVDAYGNSVHLPGIHFLKVQTGVNRYAGWTGEISTELMGATDLHAAVGTANPSVEVPSVCGITVSALDNTILISVLREQKARVYDMHGRCLLTCRLHRGLNQLQNNLPQGVYLLQCEDAAIRFMR